MVVAVLVALILVSSCGSDTAQRETSREMEASPSYDLHEWGLVTSSPRGFEVGTGPGQRVTPDEMLVVDKPVLYVHATSEFDLRVAVTPRPGLQFAERWPVMTNNQWDVHVTPGTCRGTYPESCTAPDGYCEVAELSLYETSDAACLRSGEQQLPLLFYRLRQDGNGPELPVRVDTSSDEVIVRNESINDGVGALWRVTWTGGSGTHATRVAIPATGQSVSVPRPTSGGVDAARTAVRADLGTHGLSPDETEAFMRAWDEALFGAASVSDRREVADEEAADDEVADSPVAVDEVDRLSDGLPAMSGGPRIADVLLYWLPMRDINALAGIDAAPAPRTLRRALLVRIDLNR